MKKIILAVLVLASVSANAQSDFVGSGDYRADKAKQATRDQGQDAAIHEVHMNMLTKYSESWGLEDRANIAGLQESKVDKSVFEADQARQDKQVASNYKELQAEGNLRRASDEALKRNIDANNVAQSEHINAVQGAAQSANEKADAGAVRMDGIEGNLATTDNRSINNAVRLDGAEAGIRETNGQMEIDRANTTTRIEQEQTNRATNDRLITDRLRKEETSRATADSETRNYIKETNAASELRFADTNSRIAENKAAQQKVNKQMSDTLSNHEQRIGNLEQATNSKFNNLDKRIDENKRNANAGIAGVAAMANIPQVTEYQTFAIGAGAGHRESENALAVGFSARASQNTVIKASVAGDSQQTWTVGAGVSYGW
jgi:autotransporter adhesin